MPEPLSDPQSTGRLGRPRYIGRNLRRAFLTLVLLVIAVRIGLIIAERYFGIGFFDLKVQVGPWTWQF